MTLLLLILALLASIKLCAAPATHEVRILPVVPMPADVEVTQGEYSLPSSVSVGCPADSLTKIVEIFSEKLEKKTGVESKVSKSKEADVELIPDSKFPEEGYSLVIDRNGVKLKASSKNGFQYGLQTFLQLVGQDAAGNWKAPCVDINDAPRFGYRGMLMDVSRYFVDKKEMLKLIDAMAELKLNKLHLHLTDDNGWRLEIKKYPLLTEVGSWRVDRGNEPFPARRNPVEGEPTPIGGFYTQDDIREIVAFAADRGIEVIPEIDMPAHANSALSAYPQFACPVVEKHIGVLPGIGGDNADIIYCAGNDSVFVFLQDIIDEVVDLFPSKYIHLGGDEAWKTNWNKCPLCQERISHEHLADSEELQGWFMTKMSDYVRSKGRKVIGWDELTNSSIPEDAVIMGWQGMGNAALKGAAQGHQFIMTPARLLYLIRYQGPQWFEPLTYFAGGTLKEVYEYEPVKDDWKPEYEDLLIGVQASMWNEFCNSSEEVEYQLFPRLTALAEVGWRPKGNLSWEDYLQRLDAFLPVLDDMGITYAESMYNIQQKVIPDAGDLLVELECIRPDVDIRYTLDGTDPMASSALYNGPVRIGKDVKMFKAATFNGDGQKGKTLSFPVNWHKATGRPIVDPKGAQYVLTNGVKGSLKHTDLEWCDVTDGTLTLDLGCPTEIKNVILSFINNYGMGVHRPAAVALSLSADNDSFTKIAEKEFEPAEIFANGTFKVDEIFNLGGEQARYLRLDVKSPGKCGPNHARPGKAVQVYIDEVMVN